MQSVHLPNFRRILTLCACVLSVAACSSPFNSPSAATNPIYTLNKGGKCVQLGNTPNGPYINTPITGKQYAAHSEPNIAEDPTNPLHLIGGSKYFTNTAKYLFQIGTFVSFDGGCTWTDTGPLPGFPAAYTTSDISFAFGPDGSIYAAVLYTDNNNLSGISVSISHDGGRTFGNPVTVYEDTSGATFSDKPWIAVDDTHSPYRGNVYVVWSYDNNQPPCGSSIPCVQELAFSSSTNGGASFSAKKIINGSAAFCTNPGQGRPSNSLQCDGALGAIPAVEPDGTVVVADAYIDILNNPPKIPTRMLAVASHDGGNTWNAPSLIDQIHDLPSPFPGQNYRNFSLPALAADPKSGKLYLTWPDETANGSEIMLATSADEGQTWTQPITVNPDSASADVNHFQPQIAVAPDGVVSISYFSTQADITQQYIDVYVIQSNTGGNSFHAPIRVTLQSWNPLIDEPIDNNGSGFIGDYQGLAADNNFTHPLWNDSITGIQEIFTASIPSLQPNS